VVSSTPTDGFIISYGPDYSGGIDHALYKPVTSNSVFPGYVGPDVVVSIQFNIGVLEKSNKNM